MNNKLELLRRIARFLMFQSSFIRNVGLLNGKFGITIFLYHYARFTNNNLYELFASELLDEVYDSIDLKLPVTFDNGLVGIAWGIDYLAINKFVCGDIEIILKELDNKIKELDVRRFKDNSMETGLKGLAYYIIARCANKTYKNTIVSTGYMNELINSLKLSFADDEGLMLIRQLNHILNFEEIQVGDNLLQKLTKNIDFNCCDLFNDSRSLGILDNGLAGIGLNLILNARV